MAYQPDQCWYLERVPIHLEGPAYLLQNAKEMVAFGRRVTSNDKVCNGPNVSRNHLKFVRSGSTLDWQSLRWSVMDLGGMVGTFVNLDRIDSNNPFGLNCGDLIGVGCPENTSSRDGTKETFVYRLKSPRAFHAQFVHIEGAGMLEEDDPTPPPSPGFNSGANNLPLPDVVRMGVGGAEVVMVDGQEHIGMEEVVQEQPEHGAQPAEGVAPIKQEQVEDGGKIPAVTTLDSSDNGRPPGKVPAQPDSPVVRKRRVRHLLSSSEDDDEVIAEIKRGAKVPRLTSLTSTLKMPRFRPVLCSLAYMRVPERAVAAKLEPGKDKVAKWRVETPNNYKKMSRIWAGLKEDGSEGTPLFVELAVWNDDDNLSDISSNEEIPVGYRDGDLSPISSEEEMHLDSPTRKTKKKKSIKKSITEDIILGAGSTEFSRSLTNILKPKSPTSERTSSPKDTFIVMKKAALESVSNSTEESSKKVTPTLIPLMDSTAKWKSSFGVDKITEKTKTENKELSKNPAGKVLASLPVVKIEPEDPFEHFSMNYSQNEEVIEILGSSDEEDYEANQSQSVLSPVKTGIDEEFSDVDDLLRESPSPTFDRDDVTESEMSDVPEDDDEIEILNESQSSLYATIFKAVHKVEPEMEAREEIDVQELVEIESQSLLDVMEDDGDDNELIGDIVNAVDGADENMVRSAVRKLKQNTKNGEAAYDDIFELVKEEVEDIMVKKLSKTYNCSVRQVKICLAEVKGDDKDSHVTEEMLKEAVELKLKEDELVRSIASEFKYSTDKIKEVMRTLRVTDSVDREKIVAKVREKEDLNECIASLAEKKSVRESVVREAVMEVLKMRGTFIEKDVLELVEEKMSFNEKIDSLKMDMGCSEELVRDVLTKCDGDAEVAAGDLRSKLLTHEKSKNLAEMFNTSVEYAKEKLEESGLDEAAASQALELEHQDSFVHPIQLAETFDISVEEAQELLERSGNDLAKASQILIDQMDEDARKDEQDSYDRVHVTRSDSPVFDDENDEDYMELMKICEEKEINSPEQPPIDPDLPKLKEASVDAGEIDDLLDDRDIVSKKDKTIDTVAAMKPSSASIITPATRPSISRQLSGPKLIEPLAMPHRRAFHRGISATTIDSLASKKDMAAKKPDSTRVKQWPRKLGGIFHKPMKSSIFNKPADRPKYKSKEELAADRKQKLKEVAERNKKPELDKPDTAPAGKMKSSVPKNQKLLLEMQAAETMGPPRRRGDQGNTDRVKTGVVRERRTSESDNEVKPAMIGQRRGSAGFLVDESSMDKVKRKEKYAATSDGYKAVKKMSLANIDYNVMSQDISKMHVDVKPLQFAGIQPKQTARRKMKKRLRWRDETGLEPLEDVKEIPADNKGIKARTGNKEFLKVDLKGNSKNPEGIKELGMDDVLKTVLEWKCLWLEEQKKEEKKEEPPPVHGARQILPLTQTFNSGEEYSKIFLPLMLHELWSSVSVDYEKKLVGGREEIIPVCLQEVCKDSTQQFNLVRCIGLLTEQEARRDLGVDGTLVQLNIGFSKGVISESGNQAREIRPCFGYVQQVKKMVYRGKQELGELDRERVGKLEEAAEKNNSKRHLRHIVYYTMKTKLNLAGPDKVISLDKPIFLKVLSRIKPDLRKFEALLSLPSSKLHTTLISPDSKTFKLGMGSEFLHALVKDVPQLSSLNLIQKKSAVSMARACLSEPSTPRVCLMAGPPGTGKSSTITGLVLQILYSGMEGGKRQSMPRILIVAPSDAAVDELAIKLVATRSSLPESIRFRLIRLGMEKAIKQEVKGYTFDANVERIITKGTRRKKAADSLEKDQKTKQAAANQIFEEKTAAESAGNTDLATKLHRDWKEKMQQIDTIKEELKKPLDSKAQRDLKRNAEDTTMADADVILSTLSSSLSREMDKYFVQGVGTGRLAGAGAMRPISVCIMDEASQCVEPEALIPLKLGFNKLVMVGDHEQLPATVTSMKAKKYDYQQSLFGRIFSFLTGEGSSQKDTTSTAGNTPPMVVGRCPVLRLDIQYRMNKEIADWPSRYFYGGLLHSGGQARDTVVAPYTVVHVPGVSTTEGGNTSNKEEVGVVIKIIEVLRKMVGHKPSIGVITFYAKPKQVISLEVQTKKLGNIVVNTVDGIQGSERDIIIISCAREGAGGIELLQDRQRLNVSLTRAKYSLVVVGNMDTLQSAGQMWRELIVNAKERKVFHNMGEVGEGEVDLKLLLTRKI